MSSMNIYDSYRDGICRVSIHNEVRSRKAEFSLRLRSVSAREIGGMLPKTEHLGEFLEADVTRGHGIKR